jgi:hypothetical protein
MKKIAIAFAIAGSALLCLASATLNPLKSDDIKQSSWIGCSSDGLHYYRITLNSTDGSVGYLWPEKDLELYHIKTWTLDPKGYFKVEALPSSKKQKPIWIESEPLFFRNFFKIKVRAASDTKWEGWEHHVTLYKEDMAEKRFGLLKEFMKRELHQAGQN